MTAKDKKLAIPVAADEEPQPGPRALPILPTSDLVLFPRIIMPMVIWEDPAQKLITEVLLQDKTFGVLASRLDQPEGHGADHLYDVGTAAVILKMRQPDDDSISLLVQGPCLHHSEKEQAS